MADSLRQHVACQPKLSAQKESEGWTTTMFIEQIYRDLAKKK
jgi:hypothetical protein